MNKKEFRELVGDKFEEIEEEDYFSRDEDDMSFQATDGKIYFKEKEAWPKVIKIPSGYEYRITEDGELDVNNCEGSRMTLVWTPYDIEALEEALKLCKEQRRKNE